MGTLHIIEIILIATIVVVQFIVFLKVCIKTKAYEKTFADKIVVNYDDEAQKPMLVVYDEKNRIASNAPIKDTVRDINTYIGNNWGGPVNFSIVENIIERESASKDEEIQHLIPTPLYLGLAATMIGIILGLFSMGKMDNNSSTNQNNQAVEQQVSNQATSFNTASFSDGNTIDSNDAKDLGSLSEIDNLILGVKIAMIASLLGLFWTTLLSTWIYKKAKNNVNKSKNKKLNYLQSVLLLPTEDNTLTGIRECIDKFSRNIGSTITDLSALAEINADISEQIHDSTVKQEHILTEIQQIKPAKVTKVLTELFDKVDANMEAYREFSRYLSLMGEISERMFAFSQRTQNIEEIAGEVKLSLEESRDLFRFLSEHMRGVESIGQQSLEAINAADSHFNQAVANLDREVNQRIRALSDGSNAFDTRITQIFEQIGNDLQEITRRHIEELSNAYHNSLPEFQRLEKLDGLDTINEKLDGVDQIKRIEEERSEQIQRVITPLTTIERKNESQNSDILAALRELNKRLDKIEKNTSAPQHRLNQPEVPTNNVANTPPKRKWLFKVLLPILAIVIVGILAYIFVPKFIGNSKGEKANKLKTEFNQELEKINNETPLLCEKYKLVSLDDTVNVPVAWKEDSLRYRQQLDRFWGDDVFRQQAIAAIERQKQIIMMSRQRDYDALLMDESGQERGEEVE